MSVSIVDDHIVVNGGFEYNIPLKTCGTPEEILNWARQLAEKTWITPELMRKFLEVACMRAGINRY